MQTKPTFKQAITRKPGLNFAAGLTSSDLGTPKFELIKTQHQEYVKALRQIGLEVIVLDDLEEFPDAYFVEDVAIVTPEIAILTRPGADERKGEVEFIESALIEYRNIDKVTEPGEMEGGDVMCVDNHYYIGISPRTDALGAAQAGWILKEHGHNWSMVPVIEHIHLKTSVNYIGNNTLLMTQPFATLKEFKDFEKIIVDKEDLPAVNSLLVNDHILTPKGYPKVLKELLKVNPNIIELDVSEVAKMDGGLSCMSLRF
jgi:dimethylargininase